MPFRKVPGKEACWTSNELRKITDLGYTYPELETYKEPKKLRKDILNYYRPDNYTQLRWFVNFPDIKKREGKGPFTIRIFLDLPGANAKTSTKDIHFAG